VEGLLGTTKVVAPYNLFLLSPGGTTLVVLLLDKTTNIKDEITVVKMMAYPVGKSKWYEAKSATMILIEPNTQAKINGLNFF